VAKKGSFLLRTDPAVLEALRRWADDDLRSMNGQIEFVLRKALRDAGRLKKASVADATTLERKEEANE
jgi:hypothetical protein